MAKNGFKSGMEISILNLINKGLC